MGEMGLKERTGRLSAEEALELWTEYKRSGDPALRDRLVLTFAPMVKYIVYRKVREMPARCEVEDFISCGLEALIRSIDRYDPDKGATLEQFAWTRIHGAVLDELRRNDWAPRSLRRFQRDFSSARDTFISLHGRHPSRSDLCSALEISEQELDRRLEDMHRSEVGSLNVCVTGEDDAIGRDQRLTGDTGVGIGGEEGVQHRVADAVGDLVRMARRDGFGGEQVLALRAHELFLVSRDETIWQCHDEHSRSGAVCDGNE